jgi:ABC-type proline/glycine betaine transport system permease subunit
MPRRAPTEIVEQRITFGNYERQFVTEVKNDIEKGVKIATITAVAVPASIVIGAIGGLGLLGYGIYRGMNSYAFGDALDTAVSLAKVQFVLLDKVLNPFAWIKDL